MSLVLALPFSEGKLRVAVDGDARQVVPDDLVDCNRREKRAPSEFGFRKTKLR